MKILSRIEAITIARLIAKHQEKRINANDLNYEYISVHPNGDVEVGVYDCGYTDMYKFNISIDGGVALLDIGEHNWD